MNTALFHLFILGSILCQTASYSYAQGSEDYKKRSGDPQSNYYNIAADVESALLTAPPDNSEENAGVLFARWKWFWDSRMGYAMEQAKTGKFSHYVDVMKSLVQAPSCMTTSSYPANWNLLGPVQLPRQEMGWIHSVARDPNNASVVYAGAPNGGLWRTNDVNAPVPVWENITDHTYLPGLGIGDILIDPSNSDIIYVATGFYTASMGFGVGVLKTMNGTDPLPTWAATGVNYNPFVNEVTAVKKLVMSPVDNNTIYAITGKDVFKTTDAGDAWPSMGLNAVIADNDLNIVGLVIDPLDPDNIIVSTTVPESGLWRWDNIASEWSDVTPNTMPSNAAIRLSATNSAVYALYIQGTTKRIDISTDGGHAWVMHTTTNNYGPLFIVSRMNPNIMYLGDGSGRVIYKSIDGGQNFIAVSNYNPANFYNGTSTHADIRALQLFQASSDGLSDILLAGTDGGVLYSTSAQAPSGTVVNWTNVNGYGLAVSQFYGLAGSEKVPGRIVAGAQDNGFATYDNGTWVNLAVGDGYRMVIDRENPSEAIGERIFWSSPPLAAGAYLSKSNTGGQTWNVAQSKPPWGNPANPSNYNMGVQYSPDIWNVRDQPIFIDQGNNLFIGFHDLFRYDPSSNNWTPLSDFTAEGVNAGAGCSAFAIAYSDPDVMCFAFENPTWDALDRTKKLWRTTNGGQSWTDITNSLPVDGVGVSGISIDPNNPDRIWVSFNQLNPWGILPEPYNGANRVFYSSNGGASWSDYSMGLTPLPINTIVHEQGSNDGIYVGTDVGVFYTNRTLYNADDIASPQNTGWVCFNDGFAACVVTQLEINYAANRLRASTYGRGIWESSLACPLITDLDVTTSNASGISTSFQEVSNDISITADGGDILLGDFTGRAGNEIHIRANVGSSVHLDANSHLFIHPCDLPGNSFNPKNLPVEPDAPALAAHATEVALELFPNPAQDQLQVRLMNANAELPAVIKLFDSTGRLVHHERMTVPAMQLDVTVFQGLMLVVVEQGDQRYTSRVIIN